VSAATPVVRPGQVWEDKDPREPGRQVKVVDVDGGESGIAICEVVFGTGQRPNAWGRKTRIRVSRLRSGFRLASRNGEVDAVGPAQ
jgi:hypothetical protein